MMRVWLEKSTHQPRFFLLFPCSQRVSGLRSSFWSNVFSSCAFVRSLPWYMLMSFMALLLSWRWWWLQFVHLYIQICSAFWSRATPHHLIPFHGIWFIQQSTHLVFHSFISDTAIQHNNMCRQVMWLNHLLAPCLVFLNPQSWVLRKDLCLSCQVASEQRPPRWPLQIGRVSVRPKAPLTCVHFSLCRIRLNQLIARKKARACFVEYVTYQLLEQSSFTLPAWSWSNLQHLRVTGGHYLAIRNTLAFRTMQLVLHGESQAYERHFFRYKMVSNVEAVQALQTSLRRDNIKRTKLMKLSSKTGNYP